MDQTLLTALRQSLIFDSLEEAEIDRLFRGTSPSIWTGGQVMFREGDPGDSLIVIARGWVELCRSTPAGRVIQIGKAGAGEVLGEMALLDPAPRSATATVLAETVTWAMPTGRFERMLAASEPAAAKLLTQLSQVLCTRLRGAVGRIEARLTGELPGTSRTYGGRMRVGPRDFQPSAEAQRNLAGRRSGPQVYESALVGDLEQPFPEDDTIDLWEVLRGLE